MCPGQWGFTFLMEVAVSKLRDVAFVPAGPHKAPCLGVGEGESPFPHSAYSQFSMWSAAAHLQEDVPL